MSNDLKKKFADKLYWADGGPSYLEDRDNPNRSCFDLVIAWADVEPELAKLDAVEKEATEAVQEMERRLIKRVEEIDQLETRLDAIRRYMEELNPQNYAHAKVWQIATGERAVERTGPDLPPQGAGSDIKY